MDEKVNHVVLRHDLTRPFLTGFGMGCLVGSGEVTFSDAHCIVFQLRSLNWQTTLSRRVCDDYDSLLRRSCPATPSGPGLRSHQLILDMETGFDPGRLSNSSKERPRGR